MSLNNKLKKCFEEGEKGKERHKGLRQVKISREMIDDHLKKAEHNLNAVTDFKDIGYSDWSASASFYALYHCLLALLLKFEVQSRNQQCTFAFVEDLINKKKISLEIMDIKEIFYKEIEK